MVTYTKPNKGRKKKASSYEDREIRSRITWSPFIIPMMAITLDNFYLH